VKPQAKETQTKILIEPKENLTKSLVSALPPTSTISLIQKKVVTNNSTNSTSFTNKLNVTQIKNSSAVPKLAQNDTKNSSNT
jgi:hypothetical protein